MLAASVIVSAHNAEATLGRTLTALAEQDHAGAFEVIVVDNGSTDATGRIAASARGPVRVIRQQLTGPGSGRNRGIAAASAPVLAFTDADCVPAPSWLREGLAALDGADLVQGVVRPDPEAARRPFDRTLSVGRESGLYEMANLFVRRELVEQVGGFEDWLVRPDEQPFGEDVWLGWRLRRLGARTGFSSRPLVHHAVFRRGPRAYVAERARLAYFPAMVAKIPELRETLLHRRLFLNRRSAEFDVALAGAALAAWRSPPGAVRVAGALAAAPYARRLFDEARRWGRRAPLVAPVELASDALGALSLAYGSVRRRTPVL